MKNKKAKRALRCWVPKCRAEKTEGNNVSLFRIPKEVRTENGLQKKWAELLEVSGEFSKNFLVCSRHFQSRHILLPMNGSRNFRSYLSRGATPLLNNSLVSRKRKFQKVVEVRDGNNEFILVHTVSECNGNSENSSRSTSDEDLISTENTCEQTNFQESPSKSVASVGTLCAVETRDTGVQVKDRGMRNVTSLWDSDSKIQIMTGVRDSFILSQLIDMCSANFDAEECAFSIREKTLLTFHKLKTNCSFAELAVGFRIEPNFAECCFASTIQSLAQAFSDTIFLKCTNRQLRSLPGFHMFPNVRTLLYCIEINANMIIKILIGIEPSGHINYLSKVKSSNHSCAITFNIADLVLSLQPGDAIITDSNFKIDENICYGRKIEVIQPVDSNEILSDFKQAKNIRVNAARTFVGHKIERLKQFKVLSEKIESSVGPYIDDIMTVICGLHNFLLLR